jgi:predicted DsbA family dithiol-disulfide isomerase
MKLTKLITTGVALLFTGLTFANIDTPYYEKMAIGHGKEGVVEVTYFSNPNCPSCQKFSPIYDEWKQDKNTLVSFKESAYAPFKDWVWASKSFIATKKLDESINRKKFGEFKDKSGVGNVTDILRAADVVSIATDAGRGNIMTILSSQEMNDEVDKLQQKANRYGVTGVPSLVITTADHSYRISPEFRLSYEAMLKISNALIALNLAQQNQS